MAGRTGPRTEAGKKRSSVNRQKHGLRCTGLLRCRKGSCPYLKFCLIYNEYPQIWDELEFGDDCIVEAHLLHLYNETATGPGKFDLSNPAEAKLFNSLALSHIQKQRSDCMMTILSYENHDQLFSVRLKRGDVEGVSPELAAIGRHAKRIDAHRFRVLIKAGPSIRGMIAVAKYQERLRQQIEEEKAAGNPAFQSKS